ncbi:integrator complex subunit 10 [Schistocerca cancellata]|uniref:integrator complex subunit 10 n=1 Tax=Schistocerca cancellata TaxID=274614 RepID=UPI0021177F4F|nr:integrator complex subunit 10 [Schistocerca cancellata]
MPTMVLVPETLSDEEYLVERAKESLSFNRYEAKSWMITAKTLFPDNFGVQFEAYQIEKSARSVKEAAKCISQIFQKFQDESELWLEVEAITSALRSDSGDPNMVFLRDMFSHIPTDVQHELLLQTASRSEDTMEHCRLLLLLLRQFPATIPQHGPKLVETLMTAEKHCHYQNAVNCYRKLLVYDLLPLLGTSQVDLPPKHLFRMLQKSIEFYLAYLMLPNKSIPDLPELESKIEDPWKNLFAIQEMTGKKLNWELSTVFWNKEIYWQKIVQFRADHPLTPDDYANHKQMLYCTTTFFLYCLHEYVGMLDPGGGEQSLVLLEAFTPLTAASSSDDSGETKAKRRKLEASDEAAAPILTGPPRAVGNSTATTVGAGLTSSPVVHSFLMAVRCWELLYSTESLEREFSRLAQHLKLDVWLQGFLMDAALYSGNFESALSLVRSQPEPPPTSLAALRRHLRLASICYCLGQYQAAVEQVMQVVTILSAVPASSPFVPGSLQQVSRSGRHLHFLPIGRSHLLYYCVKLVLATLKKCLQRPDCDTDLIIGHMTVLVQLDWPLEEELMDQLVQQIHHKGSFTYSPFQHYVISIDLLEEFVYLTTEQGGAIPLEIVPSTQPSSQRRISTRGADKGVKEDFKQAMRRQAARSIEPLEPLIIRFLTSERTLLIQALH